MIVLSAVHINMERQRLPLIDCTIHDQRALGLEHFAHWTHSYIDQCNLDQLRIQLYSPIILAAVDAPTIIDRFGAIKDIRDST